MKQIFWVFLLFFSFQIAIAQDQSTPIEAAVFEMNSVDQQPEFPNGIDEFYNFFKKNFQSPQVPALIGKIFLSFVVETDGTLSDIKTIKDVGFGTGAEAERVLRISPKWIPGKKDGNFIRVLYQLPIAIQTE